MLYKYPKPASFWKKTPAALKAFLFVEGVAFIGSFAVFVGLNRNSDFRFSAYKNCTPLLDSFYSFGEFMNEEYKARESDLALWKRQGKLQ